MVARAPRKKMYRSMQGRMIDIEKLRAANENVQAVGNMNVNARGDVLGAGGKIVTPKETVIRKYYEHRYMHCIQQMQTEKIYQKSLSLYIYTYKYIVYKKNQ